MYSFVILWCVLICCDCTKGFQLNITSISYLNWNETWKICPGIRVFFRTDFRKTDSFDVALNLVSSNGDFIPRYNCTLNNYDGECKISKQLGNLITLNMTIIVLFKNDTQIPIANKVMKPSLAEVRGPFQISPQFRVKADSLTFYWTVPWLYHCEMFLGLRTVLEDCHSIDNVTCGLTKETKVDQIQLCTRMSMENQISSCSRTLTGLKPMTTYFYRVRYSLGIMSDTWSAWSNTITAMTLSEVPTFSPTISCESETNGVAVMWKKPDYDNTTTKLSRFLLIVSERSDTISILFEDVPEFKALLPTRKTITIVATSCSNSGCSKKNIHSICRQGPLKKTSSLMLYIGISLCMVFIICVGVCFWKIKKCSLPSSRDGEEEDETVSPRNNHRTYLMSRSDYAEPSVELDKV